MAVVLTATVSANLSAQYGLPGAPVLTGLPSIGLPLPPIGLPLAPIGLPLPRIGLSPIAPDRTSIHPARSAERSGYSSRRDHRGSDRRDLPTIVYFIPAFGWDAYGPGSVAKSVPPEPRPTKGHLRVELQPEVNPQVYADGYYVGLLSEFPGGLPLDPGPHSLQLRAESYQPLTIDVRVFGDRSITYRGSLTAASPSPAAAPDPPPQAEPPPPVGPVYFIPGCYLGNVAPHEVTLPPGCDPTGAVRISRQ